MAFCLSIGKFNNKYKFILIEALFAFLTNSIFGYIYNDNMDLFILVYTKMEKKMTNHIIYHYIFRFLGISILSFMRFKWEERASIRKSCSESDSSLATETRMSFSID